jgi:hypothetical protein
VGGRRVADTGADGVVRLYAIDDDDQTVRITADGAVPVDVTVETDNELDTMIERTAILRPGAPADGVIVDPSGAPVPDAEVLIQIAGGTSSALCHSDAHGRWHVDRLPAGRHAASASAAQFFDDRASVFETDGVHARSGIAVSVAVGGEISGIVVDLAGAPVAGAAVRGLATALTTDATGHFHSFGERPGTSQVAAATATAASPPAQVVLGRGGHAELRLVVQPARLAGTVVDAHGAPAAGVDIVAIPDRGLVLSGQTDAAGRFDLGGAVPGSYKITVERNRQIGVELTATAQVTAAPHPVALVLPAHAAITGRVVFEGRPIPVFGYEIYSPVLERMTGAVKVIGAPDGRLTIPELPVGTWRMEIRAPGFAARTVEAIELRAGHDVELGAVELERGRGVSGRIVDADGAPVAGATVRVSEDRDGFDLGLRALFYGHQAVTSDADGRYQLTGLAADDGQRIRVTHPARGAAPDRTLAADATALDFALAATGGIDGRVVNSRDCWVGVTATSIADPHAEFIGASDGASTFHFDQLPPGDYVLGASSEPSRPSRRVTVVAGARSHVTFELPDAPPTPPELIGKS